MNKTELYGGAIVLLLFAFWSGHSGNVDYANNLYANGLMLMFIASAVK